MANAIKNCGVAYGTIFIVMLIFSIPAFGQNLPRYDADAYCKKVASVGGTYSATIENACIDQEQQAYDRLKSGWDGYPSQAESYCDRVATVGGAGSYSILGACIQQEIQARTGSKHFRY